MLKYSIPVRLKAVSKGIQPLFNNSVNAFVDLSSELNYVRKDLFNKLSASPTLTSDEHFALQFAGNEKTQLLIQVLHSSSSLGTFECEDGFLAGDESLPFECIIGSSVARRAGLCFPRFRILPESRNEYFELAKSGLLQDRRWLLDAIYHTDRVWDTHEDRLRSISVVYLDRLTHDQSCQLSLEWEVPLFVKTEVQHDGFKSIRPFMVLTGRLPDVWAATCEQYISWRWPWMSDSIIDLVDAIVKSSREGSIVVHKAQVGTRATLSFHIHQGRELTISPCLRADTPWITDILEALVWLCAALRPSERATVTHSKSGLILDTSGTLNRLMIKPKGLEEPFTGHRLDECSAGMCWHPLFPQSVVALDFPIPARLGQMKGLEIDFGLMKTMCGLEYSAFEEDSFVLRGRLTAVYPVREHAGNLQWHLRYRESARHAFKDTLHESFYLKHMNEEHFKFENINMPLVARHFLGLWPSALVTLGTEQGQDYARIECSEASEEVQTLERDTRNLSVNIAAHGFGGIGYAENLKLASHRISPAGKPPIFKEKLQMAIDTPVILYSPFEKRAWLVSSLSIVLHLAQTRAAVFSARAAADLDSPSKYDIPFCAAEENGGAAAFKALYSKRNDKVLPEDDDETLENYLDRLLAALDFCSDDRPRNKPTGFQIFGHEFLEIAMTPTVIVLKRKRLGFEKSGWLHLLDGLVPVIFYKTFSRDVIISDPPGEAPFPCHQWPSIPHGQDLLAASLPMVKSLSRRWGCESTMERVNDGLYWHCRRPLFSVCTHSFNKRCQKTQILTKNQWGIRKPDVEPLTRHRNGVVVFKYRELLHKNHLHKRRNPATNAPDVPSVDERNRTVIPPADGNAANEDTGGDAAAGEVSDSSSDTSESAHEDRHIEPGLRPDNDVQTQDVEAGPVPQDVMPHTLQGTRREPLARRLMNRLRGRKRDG
jgi:hypothetical protein